MQKLVRPVAIADCQIREEGEWVCMILESEDVKVMISSDIVNVHLLSKRDYAVEYVGVFKEDSGSVSPPHIDYVSEKNEVSDCWIVLELVQELLE